MSALAKPTFSGEYVKIRPVNLRHWPEQAARLKTIHEIWSESRPKGGLPSALDLMLPDRRQIEPRLVYGKFLGVDPGSFYFDWYGTGLRSLHNKPTSTGQTLGEITSGPYFDFIAREYNDVRKLATPRFREVTAELPRDRQPPLKLHYIGGSWPISDDNKCVTGLVILTMLVD